MRMWKLIGLIIAFIRQFVQQGAAWVGYVQYARHLVKGLSGRVVRGLTDQIVSAVARYPQNMAMPA